MPKTRLTGIVVADKMDKTVVVLVERLKTHPKYKKRYRSHEKYKAHDANNEYKTGDTVVVEETNPRSREKRWTVVSKRP